MYIMYAGFIREQGRGVSTKPLRTMVNNLNGTKVNYHSVAPCTEV